MGFFPLLNYLLIDQTLANNNGTVVLTWYPSYCSQFDQKVTKAFLPSRLKAQKIFSLV